MGHIHEKREQGKDIVREKRGQQGEGDSNTSQTLGQPRANLDQNRPEQGGRHVERRKEWANPKAQGGNGSIGGVAILKLNFKEEYKRGERKKEKAVQEKKRT